LLPLRQATQVSPWIVTLEALEPFRLDLKPQSSPEVTRSAEAPWRLRPAWTSTHAPGCRGPRARPRASPLASTRLEPPWPRAPPQLLPYLRERAPRSYDVALEVMWVHAPCMMCLQVAVQDTCGSRSIRAVQGGARARCTDPQVELSPEGAGGAGSVVARSHLRHLYYTFAQVGARRVWLHHLLQTTPAQQLNSTQLSYHRDLDQLTPTRPLCTS
jgi:hypothetical protein